MPRGGWPTGVAGNGPADPELVPIELVLPTGTWVTLWQPGWAGEEAAGPPFLGAGDVLHAFSSPRALAAYVAGDAPDDLRESSGWQDAGTWPPADFAPRVTYDLTRTAALAQSLDEDGEGGDVLAHAWSCATVLDDLAVHVDAVPAYEDDAVYEAFLGDPATVAGSRRRGERSSVAEVVRQEWPRLVGQIALRVVEPAVAAAVAAPPATAAALEDLVDAEVLWLCLDGIVGYTVRMRPDLERDPVFLGEPGELLLATEVEDLRALLAGGSVEAFPGARPWPEVVAAGADLEPYEDAVTDLDAIGDAIAAGPDADLAATLLEVQLLLLDLADWCGLDAVRSELEADRPLGRFLVAVAPDLAAGERAAAGRLAATDTDALAAAWTACVHALAGQVRLLDG